NRWKGYVAEVAQGQIDAMEYPQSDTVAPLVMSFRRKRAIAPTSLPNWGADFLRTLPLHEYAGPPKVATLLVMDLNSDRIVEVPDWTLYGAFLEKLTVEERQVLAVRGIDLAAFLSGEIELPRSSSGRLIYQRISTATGS